MSEARGEVKPAVKKKFPLLPSLKLKKPSGAVVAIFALLFFISVCIGVSVRLLIMYHNLRINTLASQTSTGQKAGSSQFHARVSQLADVLPEEIPQEAVVNNLEKVKAQNAAFYNNAENGDILLLYKHRAVLYSPNQDKIVSMLWMP
jgi:hypothetical protein